MIDHLQATIQNTKPKKTPKNTTYRNNKDGKHPRVIILANLKMLMGVICRDDDKNDKVTTIEGYRYGKYQNEPREEKHNRYSSAATNQTDGRMAFCVNALSRGFGFICTCGVICCYKKVRTKESIMVNGTTDCLEDQRNTKKEPSKVSGLICGDGSLPSVHGFYLTLLDEK